MKHVIQSLSLATLLAVSAASNAAIIKVEYQGVVDSIIGSTTGNYSVGQAISGSLFINANKAPGEYYANSGDPSAPGEASYDNAAGFGSDSNFVTGFAPTSTDSWDLVYLLDDHLGAGDDFAIGDDEYEEYTDSNGDLVGFHYFLYAGLLAPIAMDFIDGSSLEQVFSLTDLDAILVGNALEHTWKYTSAGDEVYDLYDEYSFSLTSLSASVVPEPGVLALFGLGFAGLIATRRRITATAA